MTTTVKNKIQIIKKQKILLENFCKYQFRSICSKHIVSEINKNAKIHFIVDRNDNHLIKRGRIEFFQNLKNFNNSINVINLIKFRIQFFHTLNPKVYQINNQNNTQINNQTNNNINLTERQTNIPSNHHESNSIENNTINKSKIENNSINENLQIKKYIDETNHEFQTTKNINNNDNYNINNEINKGSSLNLEIQTPKINIFKQVTSISGLLGGVGLHQAQTPEAQARLNDPTFVAETIKMARKAFLIATIANLIGFIVCIGFLYWFIDAKSPKDFIDQFSSIFIAASEITGTNSVTQKEFSWEDEMKVRMVRGGLKKLLGLEEEGDIEDDEAEMLMDASGQIDYGTLTNYRMSESDLIAIHSK